MQIMEMEEEFTQHQKYSQSIRKLIKKSRKPKHNGRLNHLEPLARSQSDAKTSEVPQQSESETIDVSKSVDINLLKNPHDLIINDVSQKDLNTIGEKQEQPRSTKANKAAKIKSERSSAMKTIPAKKASKDLTMAPNTTDLYGLNPTKKAHASVVVNNPE